MHWAGRVLVFILFGRERKWSKKGSSVLKRGIGRGDRWGREWGGEEAEQKGMGRFALREGGGG